MLRQSPWLHFVKLTLPLVVASPNFLDENDLHTEKFQSALFERVEHAVSQEHLLDRKGNSVAMHGIL